MIRLLFLTLLFLFPAALRADLIMETKSGATNFTHDVTVKVHGDMMRMDEGDGSMSVIVNLKNRDSYTLSHNGKVYLQRFGSEIKWQMQEELKLTHGTNALDAPAARPVDTGKAEVIDGQTAEIYTWSGAQNLSETLWVVTNFPNYNAIRAELAKIDFFNEGGPHRNAQPPVSLLPGMVIKSENQVRGRTITVSLVSVKLEPLDPSLFAVPPDYKFVEPHNTNSL